MRILSLNNTLIVTHFSIPCKGENLFRLSIYVQYVWKLPDPFIVVILYIWHAVVLFVSVYSFSWFSCFEYVEVYYISKTKIIQLLSVLSEMSFVFIPSILISSTPGRLSFIILRLQFLPFCKSKQIYVCFIPWSLFYKR